MLICKLIERKLSNINWFQVNVWKNCKCKLALTINLSESVVLAKSQEFFIKIINCTLKTIFVKFLEK